MTVELHPIDHTCPMRCAYCYEEPRRRRPMSRLDVEAMLVAADRQTYQKGGGFTLFGGEPLAAPVDVLERLWAAGLEKHGTNGVQTSGFGWTEQHVEMFKRYRVCVGLSLDGPGELNDARATRSGGLAATRVATRRSEELLERCVAEGLTVTVISVLSRENAGGGRLPRFVEWLQHLDELGIKSACVHVMARVSGVDEGVRLTEDETVDALLALREAELGFSSLRLDLFAQMLRLLTGQDESVSCVWTGCDPASTPAVQGVYADGSLHNCQRLGSDIKSSDHGMERQLVLMRTPRADGGCEGCRFFLACKGQCPGSAVDGDWRNRSTDCQVWFKVFSVLENDLLRVKMLPVSKDPRLALFLKAATVRWEAGQRCSVADTVKTVNDPRFHRCTGRILGLNEHGDHNDHGDHTDNERGQRQQVIEALRLVGGEEVK